jgi:hypothetical protein
MYPTTLNTNEVRNAAGTEQEFGRISSSDRQLIFALLTEVPSKPHRLTISHSETGSGLLRRRRSLVRFDKSVVGEVDTTKIEKISAYVVVDAPVGNLNAVTEISNVMANLMSNVSTTDGVTLINGGTGYGAQALINGSL